MDQLHSEILLPIFKNLTSIDMVPVRAVSRKFLEIIDSNRSLWRTLVLPQKEKGGCDSKVIVMWDDKSSSSLEEVSVHVKLEKHEIMNSSIKTLERSKETLRILSIAVSRPAMNRSPLEPNGTDFSEVFSSLAQLALVLPKVVDFRVSVSRSMCSVKLVENKDQEQKNAGLRVLWLTTGSKAGFNVTLKMMESQLLNTLVSLKLQFHFDKSSQLRAVLKRSSQTLKHIEIYHSADFGGLEALEFPVLECIESYPVRQPLCFPSWMRVPFSTQIICTGMNYSPSVSKIWFKSSDLPSDLIFRAPRLEELRIDTQEITRSAGFHQLHSLLKERKKQVQRMFKVDGVMFVPLKRLGIWFDNFSPKQLDQLRGLTEKAFDLGKVSRVVEIEI